LFTIEQWARYVGEDTQIRLLAPVAGRRRLTATLAAIEGDDVLLDVKGEALRVPFAQVDRANLVAKFG
jgi:ribosome maturation factor RimP